MCILILHWCHPAGGGEGGLPGTCDVSSRGVCLSSCFLLTPQTFGGGRGGSEERRPWGSSGFMLGQQTTPSQPQPEVLRDHFRSLNRSISGEGSALLGPRLCDPGPMGRGPDSCDKPRRRKFTATPMPSKIKASLYYNTSLCIQKRIKGEILLLSS